ncbi:16S rRNA (guanine1207-N2)-methyltransferase [Kitasatospora sp. MAP12-15]|uniref:class I SAM-dependent methyltransferase n=1 Tax=unclassified Kitasatospora TaxID=2633591 RepID=UPI002476C41F|nr:methyltransferase [Kitasatospora sp. MAP12-44]MDH6112137.1 16S rRNA (guanine1207-N2)-methyltransferase [Kitasatospora sp. MAP12-44]
MSGSHYFNGAPEVASERREITVRLPDITLELTTDAGVFSRSQLDPGTRVLLEHAPPPRVRGPILDLGCGYGPIALTWASRRKRLPVWGVDVNTRALELVTLNAQKLKLGNVQAALPDDVPEDVRFATIYSNPPIRVGKPVLRGMLHQWLGRLVPEGSAFLVVQRHLGADSLMTWLNDQGYPTTRVTSVSGFRILEARPRPEGAGPDSGRGTAT